MPRTYLKKDVYYVTYPRRLYLLQAFVTFQKYSMKINSCDFQRLIEISDKIDVGPLEPLKNLFWKQCLAINQMCRECQWTGNY